MKSPNKRMSKPIQRFHDYCEAREYAAAMLFDGFLVETIIRYSLRGDGRYYIVRVY